MTSDYDLDWFHPLSEYRVERIECDLSVSGIYDELVHVPVLWNGDVYTVDTPSLFSSEREEAKQCKLLKYSTSSKSWSKVLIPCETSRDHVHTHVLTTYHSKLLLIGDVHKVLEFDASKSTFKESTNIEPLPSGTGEVVSAASEGDNLLVICNDGNKDWTSVNIFDGKHWKVHDGPYLHQGSKLQVFIHNCKVFLAEWFHRSTVNIYKTSLQSLYCDEPHVWQVLKSTLPRPHRVTSNFISLGNHLCMVSYDHRGGGDNIRVWYYSVNYEGWLELGNVDIHDLQDFPSHIQIVGLPDGTLITMSSMFKHHQLHLKLKPEGKTMVLCMIGQLDILLTVHVLHIHTY